MLLHIIPENIKKPHITQDMPQPAMEKHIGYDGNELIGKREVCRHLGQGEFGRNKTVKVKKRFNIRAHGHLEQIDKGIDGHEGVGRHGNGA